MFLKLLAIKLRWKYEEFLQHLGQQNRCLDPGTSEWWSWLRVITVCVPVNDVAVWKSSKSGEPDYGFKMWQQTKTAVQQWPAVSRAKSPNEGQSRSRRGESDTAAAAGGEPACLSLCKGQPIYAHSKLALVFTMNWA